MKKIERTRKYLEYLRQVTVAVEDSGIEEKYRIEAFRMAATPMAEWVETDEIRVVGEVVVKYDDYIGFSGEDVVTCGYIGDLFPKITREMEAIGYHYSQETRRFVRLVKGAESDETP